MCKRIFAGFSLLLVSASLGCGASQRAEVEALRAELAETRAELKSLKAEKRQGYLEELERLEALRIKGVLTQEEFDAKKKAALNPSPMPEPTSSSIDALAKQLRMIQGLYSNGTLSNIERDFKKNKLLSEPLIMTDLKQDLETVQSLYAEGSITIIDRDGLKRRLLELEPARR